MKIYKSVILKEGKYIRLLRQGEWEFVQRSNCTGVVIILALTEDNKVIFAEQYRRPVRKNVIEFPAGLVNDHGLKHNESIMTAAKRELFEETGYRAQRIVKILQGPVSSGLTSDQVTMVRAFGLKKIGRGGGDETEGITIHEVPLKSASKWLNQIQKKGRLVDPKVYAGLYFLTNERNGQKGNG